MRTIEELNLSNNKIAFIDPDIKELLRLKILNLENNALTELPEQITQVPFLSTLILKGNPLDAKFETLLSLKFTDNLQDVLTSCFESSSPLKVSKKTSETPSWLEEEKKPGGMKEEWGLGIKKEEERLTTANRRLRAQKI